MQDTAQIVAFIKTRKFLNLLATFFILAVIPITVYVTLTLRTFTPKAEGPAIRGSTGDMWADVVIGDRDFSEIWSGNITNQNIRRVGGATVDRDSSGSTKGKLWIYSGVENRILGVNLDNCPPATGECTAEKVIGQPQTSDFTGCNGDSTFQFFPNRVPASASTLCGAAEYVPSIAENLSFVGMYSKNGNLYVPDTENHRVLVYYNPWGTDSVADEVIGQDNFAGNYCNKTQNSYFASIYENSIPSNSSLCFRDYMNTAKSGAGVTLDNLGHLWVADNGNNRVLRFPKQADGKFSKNADIVLGQPSFTVGPKSEGSAPTGLSNPNTLRFDPSGNLYVAEATKGILKYTPAEQKTGGTATVFASGSGWANIYLGEVDAVNNGIWLTASNPFNLALIGFDGVLKKTFFYGQGTQGSVGLGKDGSLVATSPTQGTLYFQNPMTQTGQGYTKNIFVGSYLNDSRINKSGGVAIAGNQLFATDDCRVLVWNDPNSLTNGKPADFALFASNLTSWNCADNTGFHTAKLKADKNNRVYIKTQKGIYIYQAPVTFSSTPIKIITDPVPTITGETVNFLKWAGPEFDYEGLFGISPQEINGQLFLWVTDRNRNRVFRLRDPLGTPKIDVVVGQTDLNGTLCNRVGVNNPQPNPIPLNYLCEPGSISIDNFNNVYISDHSLEVDGNHRLLMYTAATFPTNNTTVIYDRSATKEFPDNDHHYAFEVAFDSQNRMVVGQNLYSKSFFSYYLNPLDPNKKTPDGYFEDYTGMTYGVTFDSQDNLYVTDLNRTRVLIYKKPFQEPLGNQAPSVQFTSHQNDIWYKGGVHELKSTASDDHRSIARVEFLVDNNLISTDYFEPFETDHNFSNLDGNHNITVKAYDNHNRIGQQSITIKIDHQGPGKDVNWNTPTNGSTVSGRIPVSINADDVVSGTKKVEFLVDGNLVATDTSSDSYGFWWNTTSVSNGSHTLTAKAYDQPDNITTLTSTVTVNNSSTVGDPTSAYLAPTTAGTYAEYSEQRIYPFTSTAEFEAFDEEVPDDLWSYLFTNQDNVRYKSTAKIDSTQIPAGARITSIDVFARARSQSGSPSLKIMLRVGGSDYFSPILPITSTAFFNYKNTWATNPANGSAWTAAALANAEVGVQAWHATGNAHHVTSVWMVVNYSEGKLGDINGDNNVDVLDLSAMLTNWGTNNASCDLNADGTVGVLDLSILLSKWGT